MEIVSSTLLRSGPVALFTKFETDFYVLETEPDPECNIWKEKATECHWCPVEWFEAFKAHVPGRNYGQKDFAVRAGDIDWSQYDLVMSVDVSVPQRITRQFPSVVWCYYVREDKTPSYGKSFEGLIDGQDIFLSQQFQPARRSSRGSHIVDFPYHLQYYGCFHDLFDRGQRETSREGVFLEHHTVRGLTETQLRQLCAFGSVNSTALQPGSLEQFPLSDIVHRTMEPAFRDLLLQSKYFLKCGGRSVFGLASIEAIAAGCLALGNPGEYGNGFLFNRYTSISSFEDALQKIAILEKSANLYRREVARQRSMVDHLCYMRPVFDLFERARTLRGNRCGSFEFGGERSARKIFP
jgi:hypothetical protein